MPRSDDAAIQLRIEAQLTALEKAFNKANGIVDSKSKDMERRAKRMADKIEADVGKVDIAGKLEKAFAKSSGQFARPFEAAANVASAVLAGYAVKLADSYKVFENTLKTAGVEGQNLSVVQDRLYESANRNGVQVQALATMYGRASLAAKELGVNQAQLLEFSDTLAVAVRVQGTSTEVASGALMQLSQALGAGTVRAEEFNSVLEGLPIIAQTVATNIDRYGGSVAKLRADVVAGKVTSKEFFDAILRGSAGLDAMAAKTVPTVSQALNVLNNELGRYVGQADKSLSATQVLSKGIIQVSEHLDILIPGIIAMSTALGVGAVTNMLKAQATAAGLSGTMTGLGRSMLAAFGGPVGIAITALTLGLGALGLAAADSARDMQTLKDASEGAANVINKYSDLTGVTANLTTELGGEADTAAVKITNFAGKVGDAADQLYRLADAKKKAALADIETETMGLRKTIADNDRRSPQGRRDIDKKLQGRLDQYSSPKAFFKDVGTVLTGDAQNFFDGGEADRLRQDETEKAKKRLAELIDVGNRLGATPLPDFIPKPTASGGGSKTGAKSTKAKRFRTSPLR